MGLAYRRDEINIERVIGYPKTKVGDAINLDGVLALH